jgi:hypothetical protein
MHTQGGMIAEQGTMMCVPMSKKNDTKKKNDTITSLLPGMLLLLFYCTNNDYIWSIL